MRTGNLSHFLDTFAGPKRLGTTLFRRRHQGHGIFSAAKVRALSYVLPVLPTEAM